MSEITTPEFEAIVANMRTSRPMTADQTREIDAHYRRDPFGVTRRMALASMSQPGAVMMDAVEEDREFALAIAGMQVRIQEYIEWLKQLTGWMETANVRCTIALCIRSDMDGGIKEAAAEASQPDQPPPELKPPKRATA